MNGSPLLEWGRRILAALIGGFSSAVFVRSIAYPALESVGRMWELGAVSSMLSQTLFMPVLAGIIAGVIQPVRIYLTALAAYGMVTGMALAFLQMRLLPSLVAIAISVWGIPLALWGALLVDARPSGRAQALRGVRDLSYGLACLMTVFAILPPSVRWLPAPLSVFVAWGIPAAFFLWLAARNRRAPKEDRTTTSKTAYYHVAPGKRGS